MEFGFSSGVVHQAAGLGAQLIRRAQLTVSGGLPEQGIRDRVPRGQR